MSEVTIAKKFRMTFILTGVSLDDVDDALSGANADVREKFGQIEVVGVSLSTLRSKLRDAGHRTKMAA
jgi:hypothetical protein